MQPVTGTSALHYEFCAATDRGRVRSNNEDAVAVHPSVRLAILADGMGGYNAGEVASSMATDLIGDELSPWLVASGAAATAVEARQALEVCVDNVNSAILDASLSNTSYSGMGTTLVVAVFLHDRLMLGHIGDSRCYRLRNDVLQQITRDHSWLQEQIDAGLMTPQQAAESGGRNLVTRALGVDTFVQVEVNEFSVQAGDLFILCSDGLTDMVDDDDLAALARMPIALQSKAEQMIELANAMGGRDNISVVLVQTGAATQAPVV